MSATTTAPTIYDGEAKRLLRSLAPLDELDVRYLRKSVRFELELRKSTPSRVFDAGTLERRRARELDRLAHWIVQAGA